MQVPESMTVVQLGSAHTLFGQAMAYQPHAMQWIVKVRDNKA